MSEKKITYPNEKELEYRFMRGLLKDFKEQGLLNSEEYAKALTNIEKYRYEQD